MGTRGKHVCIVVMMVAAQLVLAVAGVADTAPTHVGSLRLGDSIFWDGPFIASAGVPSPIEPMGCHGMTGSVPGCMAAAVAPTVVAAGVVPICAPTDCIRYTLDVEDATGKLRVALDHPGYGNTFRFWLMDPDGVPGMWAEDPDQHPFAYAGYGGIPPFLSMEAWVPDAKPGRWEIIVELHDVRDSGFRMRAHLEPPVAAAGREEIRPNLRATPPFDLTFDGCQLTEIELYDAQRCLRFSTGPLNVGRGPLDLRIGQAGLSGPEVQRVYYTDGTYTEHAAGTYSYHAEHGHYHHDATAEYKLFRVNDPESGAMTQVGGSPKVGFCMADIVIAEWRSFNQGAQLDWWGECNGRMFTIPIPQATDGPWFGLTPGWGDIYSYIVEGNYVDVGANGDGLYVVQVASDPDDTVLESDDSDNLAYAFISIEGNGIDVLERGHGAHPWDSSKIVADDGRREVRN